MTGIKVTATKVATISENVTASARSLNNWPATPSTKTMGTKTHTVVSVAATTACPTSDAPTRTRSVKGCPPPPFRWRSIPSSTTMELSTNIPIPKASPPRDIIFSDTSNACRKKKVVTTEIGIETPMMRLLEFRRNRYKTRMASIPPYRAVLRTSSTDCWIKIDWSKTTSKLTPDVSPVTVSRTESKRSLTARPTWIVFVPASL